MDKTINIGSNAKTSNLEIRFYPTHKENREAGITILIADAKSINTFDCINTKRANAVCRQDALTLNKGIYK